jgi:hypothetical protein
MLTQSKVSRRDFLKLMGAGAAAAVFGKLMDNPIVRDRVLPSVGEAQAQSSPPWTTGYLTSIAPIHAILLSNGKILAVAGSGYHVDTLNGPYLAQVIDPATGDAVSYTMSEDIFCAGHNHLANGNVLLTGGMLRYDVQNSEGRFLGLKSVYEFDVYTNSFVKLQSMPHGRWYPTQVTLPDGKTWVHDGLDEFGTRNALVEIYDPVTKTMSIRYNPSSGTTYTPGHDSSLPGAGTQTYGGPGQGVSPFTSLYPRMHLMPSGLLLVCGMDQNVYMINPTTGAWTLAGTMQFSWRDYGTTFLLPLHNTASERGKVLVTGGQETYLDAATATSEILDFDAGTTNSPVIRSTASMNVGRVFPLNVIMPDGKLALFGGASRYPNEYIHVPEAFDPESEAWSTLPEAGVSRSYHSAALLLPDGRVWTASGTPDRASWEHRVEFYNPPYYYSSSRPVINGRVTSAPYGGTIRIPTSNTNITRVSLIRLGSNTHHYDANLRLVWLQVTATYSGGIQVAAPINANVAPPGPYMIHILNAQNIPSQAKIIQIPG